MSSRPASNLSPACPAVRRRHLHDRDRARTDLRHRLEYNHTTKFKIIAAAIALSIPGAAFAAAGCCAGMTCCKDGADCCKDKDGKSCCDGMKKDAAGKDAAGKDAPDKHAGHDMSGMGKK